MEQNLQHVYMYLAAGIFGNYHLADSTITLVCGLDNITLHRACTAYPG